MADELDVKDLPVGQTKGESVIRAAGAAYLKEIGTEAANTPLKEEKSDDDDAELEEEEEEKDLSEPAEGDDDDELEDEDDEDATAGSREKKGKGADDDEHLVTLAGAEGEDPLEIEVEDPAVRSRILALQSLATDFQAKDAARETREAELDDLHATMAADPVGFTLEHISKDSRLAVLQALLLEHFDDVTPLIEEYFADPGKVREDKLTIREKRRELKDQVATRIENNRAARQIMQAVRSLVPAGTPTDELEEFMGDAERDLILAARAGTKIAPAEVKKLLARRLKLYGYATPKAMAAAKPSNGTARPVTDRAKASAEKLQAAKAEQERRKRVQVNRRHAGAIPSGGRGATSVTRPVIKKGSGIKEAGKAILKTGAVSWADIRSR